MGNVLKAKERKDIKHSSLNKLRKEGNIPAVVYGQNVESKAIYLRESEFLKIIKENGRNGIISLDIDGEKKNVMLTDYQQDKLSRSFKHVDFLAINLETELQVDVRVKLEGEAAGVKDGGVLQQALHELSVSAKPQEIPESIDYDVTHMVVGDTLTVHDLKAHGNYTINNDDDEVIASILPPKQEEEIDTGEQQEEGVPENEEGRETPASNQSQEN